MMPYENVKIQLVDMPPMESSFYEPWMGSIVRQTDVAMLVADLSADEELDEIDGVLILLENSRIRLCRKPETEPGQDQIASCRALLAANKCDSPKAPENLEILEEFFGGRFDILAVSAVSGQGLDTLRRKLFDTLDVVRIFTKIPGKKADLSSPPFVLKRGSTVLDAARAVHREFVHSLKFAKIWNSEISRHSVKYEGQMVERTHCLEDGDILEFHV
jgi:ribosome-interacting GTPase 1